MACIHYRFPFQADYKFITLNGLQITVGDLKAQIMKQERLKFSNCDLKISNDQDEEYTDETTPLEKYSCVIVRRIPIRVCVHHAKSHPSASSSLLQSTMIANLVDVTTSEEDRIRVEMLQSSHRDQIKLESQKYLGPSPPHYVCHLCGQPGHHIEKCHMQLNALKKARRCNVIPQSFLVKPEAGDDGAMLTSTGGCLKAAVEKEGYKHDKKEDPPFPLGTQLEPEVTSTVPDELMCVLCKLLMVNAAIVPCCGYSFCDNCIRTVLLESEQHICITCQQTVSPDSIIPNLALRLAITKFESNTGYTKCRREGPNGKTRVTRRVTRRSAPYSSRPPICGLSNKC